MPEAAAVVAFWREAGPTRWFARDAGFDARCRDFLDLHFAASRRELDHWRGDAEGALALLILLDQIPRNVFRDSAHAYATDPLARSIAAAAIDAGFDRATEEALRVFFYLPFEHAESLDDQREAVRLFGALRDDPDAGDYHEWAVRHLEVIERFGRFPHRNDALGRASTAQELTFLAQPGSRF